MLLTLLYLLAAFVAAVLLFVMVYHVRRHGVTTLAATARGLWHHPRFCPSASRRHRPS